MFFYWWVNISLSSTEHCYAAWSFLILWFRNKNALKRHEELAVGSDLGVYNIAQVICILTIAGL